MQGDPPKNTHRHTHRHTQHHPGFLVTTHTLTRLSLFLCVSCVVLTNTFNLFALSNWLSATTNDYKVWKAWCIIFGGGGVYHRNQSWPRISQNLGCVSPKTLFWNVENCNAMVVMLQLGTFPSESNFKSSVVCHLQHNTTPLTSSNLKLNFTWKWRWTELSQYIHLLTFEMYCETISGCGRLIQYYTFLPLCCLFCLFVSLCLTLIWAARNKLPRSSSSWPKYWHYWFNN